MDMDTVFRAIIRDEVRAVLRDELRAVGAQSDRRGENGDAMLSVVQAAVLLGAGKTSVRNWISAGRLKACRAGRLVRVRRCDIESFLQGVAAAKGAAPTVEAEIDAILGGRKGCIRAHGQAA